MPAGSDSEVSRKALEPPTLDGDQLEATVKGSALGMAGDPGLGGSPEPPTLLRRHHLERMPEVRGRLAFHLAEDDPAAAPDDQVELVASRPDVRAKNPITAQPVVTSGAALKAIADPSRVQAASTVSGWSSV